MAEGYTRRKFRNDLLAGAVVGIVALPLSMALAIAAGVAPQHGLYTAIVAGAVIAALGGSRMQVSGPTAAFVVILVPIVNRFGVGGLLVATMMAGAILVGFGVARMGKLIQFIPLPVTAGFTAGIALVIAVLQLKDFFGLTPLGTPEHFTERVGTLIAAAPGARWEEALIGAGTLAVLLGWPKLRTKIPAPLVALAAAAVAVLLLRRLRARVRRGHDREPVPVLRGRRAARRHPPDAPDAGHPLAPAGRRRGAAAALLLGAAGPPAGRLRHRGPRCHRIAAVRGGRRRHGRHQARSQRRTGGAGDRQPDRALLRGIRGHRCHRPHGHQFPGRRAARRWPPSCTAPWC